ncbi:MAG: methyl-accepting chemotaxis protein [Rhodocyclales bacterium GT-UBC]|nr:MAG: methyl-accepting chemotaxis protein [Rhodocyclales bacterium GT-UBC]
MLFVVIVIFLIAGGFLTHWLGNRLEQRGIDELSRTNQQIVDMVDAYASALEKSAEMLGASFAGNLPKRLAADSEHPVVTGGNPVPALRSTDTIFNNHTTLVDQFSNTTGGVATLFVRQGDDFVRISSSLRDAKGERVIGTTLGNTHPARAKLLAGSPFTGPTKLFGRSYMARYTPLLDEHGKVIGVSFVGLDFTDSLQALKSRVLAIKVGETGYAFALDATQEPGMAVIHPAAEGKNLLGVTDRDGLSVAKRLIDMKQGVLRYWWKNKDDDGAREKIAVVAPFERWGWVVSTSAYTDEFSREVTTVQRQLALAGLFIVVVLGLVIMSATKRWISRPMAEAVAVTQRVAAGDLTGSIEAKTQDEVGLLLTALDGMSRQLRQMVSEIDAGIHGLATDAQRLSSASDAVAHGSGEQSNSATTMASTVEEMTTSIHQVAQHAEACRALAETSSQVSEAGIEVINAAIEGMSRIADTVTHSSHAVMQLGRESEQISQIVNVIREIADQTNLLALNAAIEAARAGEAGRGFAVVADEVRKLAERTTQSTQEITRMIESIQRGAHAAVEQMQTGERQVSAGVQLASEAGGRISAIKEGASDVSVAVVGISDALREQSVANMEIARNVECIAQQAEENHVQAKSTADTAMAMEALSAQLRASIARFKT